MAKRTIAVEPRAPHAYLGLGYAVKHGYTPSSEPLKGHDGSEAGLMKLAQAAVERAAASGIAQRWRPAMEAMSAWQRVGDAGGEIDLGDIQAEFFDKHIN